MFFLRYLLLLIIVSGSLLFCIRKLRFSQALSPLVTILGNTLLLYIFALINFLLPGAYILAGINLILGILAFINWPKQKHPEKFILSPVLFTWILIFIGLIVYTRGLLFYGWDEFSYWGVITKYMLATNFRTKRVTFCLSITRLSWLFSNILSVLSLATVNPVHILLKCS